MFDFSGRPDLTQKYARQTLLESYFDDTSGQLGNDDCGQMSAWYVFSSMGFYPVNPASGEYMIGSPIFDKVTINNPKQILNLLSLQIIMMIMKQMLTVIFKMQH